MAQSSATYQILYYRTLGYRQTIRYDCTHEWKVSLHSSILKAMNHKYVVMRFRLQYINLHDKLFLLIFFLNLERYSFQ